MNKAILVQLSSIPSAPDDVFQWFFELADELNSSLPNYEVRFVHVDMDNYLEFRPREVEAEDGLRHPGYSS